MHVTVVHNPKAGYGSFTKGRLLEMLDRRDYEVDYWPIDAYGEDAVRGHGEMVVVVGGDGTVRKVASRLVGKDVPIAVLPQGTANNICRTLGWSGDPESMIPRWRRAHSIAVDAGIAHGPWGRTCFFEAAGLGLFAHVMPALSVHKKQTELSFEDASDELRYDVRAIREALAQLSARYCGLTLDGEDFSGDYLLVEAMNMKALGPGLRLAPDADPHDGLLDVVLVRNNERDALKEILDQRSKGDGTARLNVRRARSLEISWNGDAIHADDNVWPQTYEWEEWAQETPSRVEFSVRPRAVRFLAP